MIGGSFDDWAQLGDINSISTVNEVEVHTQPKSTSKVQESKTYLDPEGAYSFKSDIWSFGVVAHQIWTGGVYEPYANTDYSGMTTVRYSFQHNVSW